MQSQVSVQFCQVFAGVELLLLSITPWCLVIMLWQLFFAGRRCVCRIRIYIVNDNNDQTNIVKILLRKQLRAVSPCPQPVDDQDGDLSKIKGQCIHSYPLIFR